MAHVIIEHPIELTWLTLAMVAFALYSSALRDAIMNEAFAEATGLNGRGKLIADDNIREEMKRCFIAFLHACGAVAAAFLPSHRVGVGIGIATMIIMILFAILNRMTRKKLREYKRVDDALKLEPQP